MVADRYERDFGVRSVDLTNAPRYEALAPTPIDEPIRLVRFGWPDPQRRLEDTLAAMELLDEHYQLDLLLAGPELSGISMASGGVPRAIRGSAFSPMPMRELHGS